jgi:hypothetical protein
MRVERQLVRHRERRNEHHSGASVGGETASEIHGMLGFAAAEERYDDAPIANGRGAPRETAGPAGERAQVRTAHHRSW